ncbi:class I SAM-dependent DNA methyltransferase [Mesorhizobium yinganensis]|uniref:class I SAM-dependent DNA methyltransferase n=1 Tax=Mesorhizobium yinganensis TaxID=3157707 RepID=UPI0032B86B7D
MKPLPASSGDLIADRRADYAEMLFANGEHAAAAELMLGALELAPAWAMGWFRLGEFQEAAGAPTEAARAWRMALQLAPDDRPGAALKLQLIGEAPASTAPPSAFVETLFDQYADKFDHALVETLGYRAPQLLEAAIHAAAPGRTFRRAVDLGCGTGLMGERLRSFVNHLEGHDISAAMLKKAAARKIYDRLQKSDLQTLELEPFLADLVTAADVFMYVGALERVFATVAGGLEKDGLFAFTVERYDGAEDFRLRETRRYAHSEAYVRRVLARAGFSAVTFASDTIRMDRTLPVTGLIVVALRLPDPFLFQIPLGG